MSENQTADRATLSNWLTNNPKILGLLWALTLLLAEVGPALAGGGGTGSGP